mmetsp:Transcript_9782/g.28106  ORF Transcript_9782/g.28106 Transcript_9782/m.28106 type:complete len:259 (-) Transcript_9782:862-1638(-)
MMLAPLHLVVPGTSAGTHGQAEGREAAGVAAEPEGSRDRLLDRGWCLMEICLRETTELPSLIIGDPTLLGLRDPGYDYVRSIKVRDRNDRVAIERALGRMYNKGAASLAWRSGVEDAVTHQLVRSGKAGDSAWQEIRNFLEHERVKPSEQAVDEWLASRREMIVSIRSRFARGGSSEINASQEVQVNSAASRTEADSESVSPVLLEVGDICIVWSLASAILLVGLSFCRSRCGECRFSLRFVLHLGLRNVSMCVCSAF